ncbi:MAG: flagellar biosynthesis anti-sigma factor FlgM [Candidatus Latescibacteria bacterium]|jgi:negative regulator of flagellin synthesis FlgM|nr:flagellar biosynthesis anti-sigma factor FlgM [Candidatus Latescibacterota bacterium]MBT4137404.1 flagellar biosynthesis anti-sigma factor FlgM [Candidatus Latescibacterota bacterium]
MPGRVDGNLPPKGPQRTQQENTRRVQENRNQETASAADAGDRVELSSAAQESRELESRLQNEVRNLPDVREERVAEVRERIASGDFDNENVRRVIADRILTQLGLE